MINGSVHRYPQTQLKFYFLISAWDYTNVSFVDLKTFILAKQNKCCLVFFWLDPCSMFGHQQLGMEWGWIRSVRLSCKDGQLKRFFTDRSAGWQKDWQTKRVLGVFLFNAFKKSISIADLINVFILKKKNKGPWNVVFTSKLLKIQNVPPFHKYFLQTKIQIKSQWKWTLMWATQL